MITNNKRICIGIIGHILLIANWFFVFAINSYMFDHKKNNNGILPVIFELVIVVVGFTALAVHSHLLLKNNNGKENMFSIQLLLFCFLLCIVSICFINNSIIRYIVDMLGVDRNIDVAVFYASSFLFLLSGVWGMDCRRGCLTVKCSLAICFSLLGVYVLIHNA